MSPGWGLDLEVQYTESISLTETLSPVWEQYKIYLHRIYSSYYSINFLPYFYMNYPGHYNSIGLPRYNTENIFEFLFKF